MGEVQDAIEAALQATATRPIPKSPAAQMRALHKAEKGSTAAVARRLGTSPATVRRYLTGRSRTPKPGLAAALDAEVRRTWQPRVRARAIKAAARSGIAVETRARFGFSSSAGSTDDPRLRRITQALTSAATADLLAAHQAGADEAQLRQVLADGLGHSYFRGEGTHADGLDVELTDVDYLDVDLT